MGSKKELVGTEFGKNELSLQISNSLFSPKNKSEKSESSPLPEIEPRKRRSKRLRKNFTEQGVRVEEDEEVEIVNPKRKAKKGSKKSTKKGSKKSTWKAFKMEEPEP